MGYDSDSPSNDGRDEDDEDEYEEASGGNRLLGFMFGNVDNSGDLDVDYLDEDAKEHLAALADKLGPSLLDLTVKSPHTPSDAADQDYDEKAENAVNYEDIDEEYEGPEVQSATEEDFLLLKKEFLLKEVSVNALDNASSVFDDENYDEEDENDLEKENAVVESNDEVQRFSPPDLEKENVVVESNDEVQRFSPPGNQNQSDEIFSQGESLPEDIQFGDTREMGNSDTYTSESEEEDTNALDALEEPTCGDRSTLLPVLYVEDGKAILRFSEIFGIHEPAKKAEKRDRRCIIPKGKLNSVSASYIVEEDEEKFLKASCDDFSWMRTLQRKSNIALMDNEEVSLKPGIIHGTTSGLDNHRMDSFISSEPMKDDPSICNFQGRNSPQFYPFDQQDWEDRILWNNSPLPNESFVESRELSGPDSDANNPNWEGETQNNKNPVFSFPISSNLLETFTFEDPPTRFSNHRFHPQLLRLESRLDEENSKNPEPKDVSSAMSRFTSLTLQNRALHEGSWLDHIMWDPHQPVAKPKLILDLQDEQMLFEISEMNGSDDLRIHAGAMIIARSVIPSNGESVETHGHGSGGRFNISNDKFYSNRKSSQQLRSHSKKRTAHGLKVLHSVPALKLQTMKTKLSNKDIANFHRPKALWYPHDIEVPLKEHARLATHGSMKIIMKSLGGKGSKLHVDAEETISSVKAKAAKKLDFKLSEPVRIFHSGRELEENNSLAEQNVRPNSVVHLIRTKIHLLPRAQKIPGENKSLRPPGAFKKKSDLSVKDGHVFLMEYCEERPLLLGNAGMGARLCTYYQKSAPGDQMGPTLRNGNSRLGSVVVLDPADKSPFLGDIKPGLSQSCLETNMYRAPIFRQKVSSSDYLLVRSAKGRLSIRRIDRIDVVGQQEPHIEVMSPGSKNVQFYIMNRLIVYMYREFRASEKRGSRPSTRADELSALFPGLSEAFLRKRLKNCADLQRGQNGQLMWVMKRNFRIPSEEELRRMVTPENVCAYESMQAGIYRLKRLGITRLTQPTGLSSAMNQLPDEAIALAAASHIERELQITPWNLSSNFVSSTNQDRENIERLEITGVGDPSGRGLGFSYVRATPKAPVQNSMVKKKAIVGKGTTVTGTDADLRRLSMEAARELLLKFNVPEDQIAKQTRWHRIALIRKLSSEQAESGVKVDPTTVSKFARGQRMSFLQLQQQTREKCQEIWDRQVQSLCCADGEENESESEANSDLDSFAGDLENLLDAEEGEEAGNFNNSNESKRDSMDGGVKGLKMRRRPFQPQAEEEIEDEAEEAAELCKMLMDDEEADRKKKKKIRTVGEQVGLASKSKFGPENADKMKKHNAAAKKLIQPEGFYTPTHNNFMKEQKELENFSSSRILPGKLKAKKKNETEQTGFLNKKVKILADGMNAIKEKKSARDSFVCGACGQLGHMKTNKNCPKYREVSETRVESTDLEKSSAKPSFTDHAESSHKKTTVPKKPFPKISTKFSGVELIEDDKDRPSSAKAKVLKVKCGANDKLPDNKPSLSEPEMANKNAVKVNKIVFSNRPKNDDIPPETPKPATIVIKPPADADRDQSRKKIVIKRPKEVINLDDSSFDVDTRKTKKIIELSSFDQQHRVHDTRNFYEDSSSKDNNQWRRNPNKQHQEERFVRVEKMRMLQEQPSSDLLRYEEGIRREREEEERQKAKAKKNKKRSHEFRDDYLDDVPTRRNDRRGIPERDRMVRRKVTVENAMEYAQPSKRRRGGEVILSNILETIVETLRDRKEISYLFLKPVSKKEAPDYHAIIDRPMDLSTIRDKNRRMEYKNRDEFRHDMCQIVFNAHRYNDRRNPSIPPLADQLFELCEYLLDQYDAELSEAEGGIE